MTDLRQMTAAEALRWLHSTADGTNRVVTPSLALACFNVGLTDTDSIEGIGTGARAEEVRQLGKRGPLDPPLTSAEINMIAMIGHRVLAEDRDNADEWWLFAQRLEETRLQWGGSRRSLYIGHDYGRTLIDSLLDAGRGPRYARDILDRAAKAGLLPNTYGWEVEPAMFSDLAAAGVRNATQIAEWKRALGERFTPARMLTYAAEGVASSVAVAAAERGVPEFEWAERLAGIPAGWVTASSGTHGHRPDQIAVPRAPAELPKGADDIEWSLDDLAYLARHGWDSITDVGFGLTSVLYGHGRRSGGRYNLQIDEARMLADFGLTPRDLARWKAALSEGKYRDDGGNPPPLASNAKVPGVCALHDAGVRPSHVLTWRVAGCRSVEDVLTAVRAGVTPARARELTERHAEPMGRYQGSKRGFYSVAELLRWHRGEG